GTASGMINAGGSFGQFVFAPLLQTLIFLLGWMGAMWSLAVISLAVLPLARVLRGSQAPVSTAATSNIGDGGLRAALKTALADRSYLLLHAGFFTCGFHIAFLVTHLPGEVDLCGLPASVASWSLAIIGLANIFGSLVGFSAPGSGGLRSRIMAITFGCGMRMLCWPPRPPYAIYRFVNRGLNATQCQPSWPSSVGRVLD